MIKLIDATHILCSAKIKIEELDEAEALLNSFVDDFEILYGETHMVYNVHLLKHLSSCVKFIGPLYCYSNYNFEDHIGHLIDLHKGTTDVVNQISEKYLLEKSIHCHMGRSSIFRDFYEHIYNRNRYHKIRKIDDSLLIGNVKYRLTEHEKLLIIDKLNLNSSDEIEEYDSMLFKNRVYYEIECRTSHKLTNDSFIFNTENSRFATIESIFLIGEKIYILVNEQFEELSNDNKCKTNIFLKKLDFCRKNVYEAKIIGNKYALIQFDETIACSPFPNMIERN